MQSIDITIRNVRFCVNYDYEAPDRNTGYSGRVHIDSILYIYSISDGCSHIVPVTQIFLEFVPDDVWREVEEKVLEAHVDN